MDTFTYFFPEPESEITVTELDLHLAPKKDKLVEVVIDSPSGSTIKLFLTQDTLDQFVTVVGQYLQETRR